MSKDKFKQGRDMDDVPTSSRGNDRVKPSELVDVFDIPTKYVRLRPFGPVFSYGGHWVKTKGKDGKTKSFYTPCHAYDSETGQRDTTKKCPWCAHQAKNPKGDEVRFTVDYWTNAIVRSLQKSQPAKLPKPTAEEVESGFKDKDSESWTPVRAVRMATSVFKSLKDLKQLNVHEDPADGESKAFSISHPKFGCDFSVKNNPEAAPAQRYSVQKGDTTPLTKEERKYLIYDISEFEGNEDLATANSEYKKWADRNGFGGDSDDDEDEDAPKGKKSRRSHDDDDDEDDLPKSKKKPSKSRDEDEDEDEDDLPKAKKKPARKVVDDDDEDEDEDDLPKAKKKPAGKKVVDEDDEDEDEDDEDDFPKSKKKSVKKVVDEDDDEDEDEDDLPKSKKKPVKKVVDEDDEDEDEDDDLPPPKKGKAPAKKPARKVVDEDDEDEDEDEDEDDVPPPKKGKGKPAAKKSRSFDDDDEDEDEDE